MEEEGKPHYDDRVPHGFAGGCQAGMGNRKIRQTTAVASAAAELPPWPFRPHVSRINITNNTHTPKVA